MFPIPPISNVVLLVLCIFGLSLAFAMLISRKTYSRMHELNAQLISERNHALDDASRYVARVRQLERDSYQCLLHTKGLMMSVSRQVCADSIERLRMAEALAHAMPYLAPVDAQPVPEMGEQMLSEAEKVAVHHQVKIPSRDEPALLFTCLVALFEATVFPQSSALHGLQYWQDQSQNRTGVSPDGAA